MSRPDDSDTSASPALLSAALGGLLCMSFACSASKTSASVPADGGAAPSGTGAPSASAPASTGAPAPNGAPSGTPTSSATTVATGAPPLTDAGFGINADDPRSLDGSTMTFACDGGVSPAPRVLSTTMMAMTSESFRSQCDAMGGVMEIQPHCGGSNRCRGMSYDTQTQTLSQHTCRMTNTCGGYSCIVCG